MLFVHSLYSPFCKSHVLTHPNCCLIHCTMRLEFVPLITSSESRRKKPVAKWANKITPSWAVLIVGSPFGEKHLYIYIYFFFVHYIRVVFLWWSLSAWYWWWRLHPGVSHPDVCLFVQKCHEFLVVFKTFHVHLAMKFSPCWLDPCDIDFDLP